MRPAVLLATAAGAAVLLAVPTPGWGALLGVTSAKLAATAPATPIAYPNSVVSANGGGGGTVAGRPEKTDTVTVVFSVQLSQATLCSTWTNGTSSRSVSGTVSITDGGAGNDVLTVTTVPVGTCASGFRFGSLDLGSPGYVTATRTYGTSTIALTQTATATTLRITLGTASGAGTTVSGGSVMVYTPDPLVADLSGNQCGLNTASSPSVVQL